MKAQSGKKGIVLSSENLLGHFQISVLFHVSSNKSCDFKWPE